ncbi:hypothetical protein FQN52_003462 [Onygenales sp. PD_12]|nr:hypothetical protein FQN52_003462 [Onygenales sp. PD_12]
MAGSDRGPQEEAEADQPMDILQSIDNPTATTDESPDPQQLPRPQDTVVTDIVDNSPETAKPSSEKSQDIGPLSIPQPNSPDVEKTLTPPTKNEEEPHTIESTERPSDQKTEEASRSTQSRKPPRTERSVVSKFSIRGIFPGKNPEHDSKRTEDGGYGKAPNDQDSRQQIGNKDDVTPMPNEKDRESKELAKDFQKHCSLWIIYEPNEEIPFDETVDIVVVHDFNESKETAWVWQPGRNSTTKRHADNDILQPGSDTRDAHIPARRQHEQHHSPPGGGGSEHRDSRRRNSRQTQPPGPEVSNRQTHGSNMSTHISRAEGNTLLTTPPPAVPTLTNEAVQSGQVHDRQTEPESFQKAEYCEKQESKDGAEVGISLDEMGASLESHIAPLPMQIDQTRGKQLDSALENTATIDRDRRSSRPSTKGEEEAQKKIVRWLEDKDMLPGSIPNARVLGYTYPNLSNTIPWRDYREYAAQEFLKKLMRRRASAHSKSPILYIGHGFGGLVLQKALTLATQSSQRAAKLLDPAAGFIFVNTPFPVLSDDMSIAPGPVFPDVQNSRQEAIIRRVNKQELKDETPEKFESWKLWKAFDHERSSRKISLAWLYKPDTSKSSQPPKQTPVPITPPNFCVRIRGGRSTRFTGPTDDNYKIILHHIKKLLLFKICASEYPDNLLLTLLTKANFPVTAEDDEGRTPLHVAGSSSNSAAVTLLISKGRLTLAEIMHPDNRGRTPLHATVQEAVRTAERVAAGSGPDKQDSYTKTIQSLIEHPINLQQSDDSDKTAWDYISDGDEYDWLRELQTRRFLVQEEDNSLEFSEPTETQEMVCKKATSVLAEFYKDRKQYVLLHKFVHEVLYEKGPETFLSFARPPDVESPTCRWFHLPANNEEWFHKLFIELGIQDKSMANQRREGSMSCIRYMIAGATRYNHPYHGQPTLFDKLSSTPSENLSVHPTETEAVVIFMPILGFERNERQKTLGDIVDNIDKTQTDKGADYSILLTESYLKAEKPLHPRRNLDQFSYTSRDSIQVLSLLGEERTVKDEAPILMVDQLWLWILQDGTVISGFPDTFDTRAKYNLINALQTAFAKNRITINSPDDLVHFIIKFSVDFFTRHGPDEILFPERFQSIINIIAKKETDLFRDFHDTTKRVGNVDVDPKDLRKVIEDTLEFKERDMLILTKDIQDELNIIKSVLEQQKSVLDKLLRMIPAPADLTKTRPKIAPSIKGKERADKRQVHFAGSEDDQESENDHHEVEDKWYTAVLKNRSYVDDNISVIKENIRIVTGMTEYAFRLQKGLDHLLDLKQKQANIWQTSIALKAQAQTQRQGNIMFLWTFVTIVFLPLSFMSSFFAIEVKEFPQGDKGETAWPIRLILGYLLGISAALIIPLFGIAFFLEDVSSFLARTREWITSSKKSDTSPKPNKHTPDSDTESVSGSSETSDTDSNTDTLSYYTMSSYYPTSTASSTKRLGWFTFPINLLILRNLWKQPIHSPSKESRYSRHSSRRSRRRYRSSDSSARHNRPNQWTSRIFSGLKAGYNHLAFWQKPPPPPTDSSSSTTRSSRRSRVSTSRSSRSRPSVGYHPSTDSGRSVPEYDRRPAAGGILTLFRGWGRPWFLRPSPRRVDVISVSSSSYLDLTDSVESSSRASMASRPRGGARSVDSDADADADADADSNPERDQKKRGVSVRLRLSRRSPTPDVEAGRGWFGG